MKRLNSTALAVAAVVITLSSCDTLDVSGPGFPEPPTVDKFTPRAGVEQEGPPGWGRPKPGPILTATDSSSVAP